MIKNYLVIASIFISGYLQAQTAHYWTESYGTRSMLLNGVVVGSVQDLGAVYYNPARLAQFKSPAFVISGQVYELKGITVKNGLGDGLDLNKSNCIPANKRTKSRIIAKRKNISGISLRRIRLTLIDSDSFIQRMLPTLMIRLSLVFHRCIRTGIAMPTKPIKKAGARKLNIRLTGYVA